MDLDELRPLLAQVGPGAFTGRGDLGYEGNPPASIAFLPDGCDRQESRPRVRP